jgi:hypothetical protein
MRLAMVWLSYWFNWRSALRIVKPETFTRWHRQGFRLFWRWKSRPGRPTLPKELEALIRRMALENPTWGQERIANELLLKLGLRVSHESRRLLHVNVTAHPTAQWTMQQFRDAIPADHPYRFLIHDRDSIFSKQVDQGVRNMGLRVLKTPVRTPVANSICERVIGTLRRECLDFVIPLSERHLYGILKEWVHYYNKSRPHQSLGPGIPQPSSVLPVSLQTSRHQLPMGQRVVARSVLGGLHQEYGLQKQAA